MTTHISYVRSTPEEDWPEDFNPCCMGSAEYGPNGCTCWEPIFDADQALPAEDTKPTTREKCCVDCAFRAGSPESQTEDGREELEDIVGNLQRTFWCHQGMRKVIGYRHPDGRTKPAEEGDDYQPLIRGDVPYNADGHAGARCAGWLARREKLLADA